MQMMREAKQGHQNIVIFYSVCSATCNKLLDWKATKTKSAEIGVTSHAQEACQTLYSREHYEQIQSQAGCRDTLK